MSLTHVLRRPMIRLAVVVVAAAGLAALTLVRNADATTSASKHTENSVVRQLESYRSTHHAVPTIVLVHGAWADASSWSGEVATFQQAGYTVRAIANPLADLTTDAETVADFLKTVEGPIVLVGHSYGGSVITNAAAGNPNVKALVYVDAAAPAPGETNGSLSGSTSALNADPSTLFDMVTYPGAPPGAQDLYLKKNIFENNFGNDLPTVVTDGLWGATAHSLDRGVPNPVQVRGLANDPLVVLHQHGRPDHHCTVRARDGAPRALAHHAVPRGVTPDPDLPPDRSRKDHRGRCVRVPMTVPAGRRPAAGRRPCAVTPASLPSVQGTRDPASVPTTCAT
jgi:pimeloyl-ACP methyl ester carboxylesterase